MDIYFLLGIACFGVIGFWQKDSTVKTKSILNFTTIIFSIITLCSSVAFHISTATLYDANLVNAVKSYCIYKWTFLSDIYSNAVLPLKEYPPGFVVDFFIVEELPPVVLSDPADDFTGFPAAMLQSGISLVMTLPAPITTLLPI